MQKSVHELIDRTEKLERLHTPLVWGSYPFSRHLLQISPVPIIVHQKEKIVFINPAGLKMLGGSRLKDFINKSIFNFVHPAFTEIAAKRIHQLIFENKPTKPVELKLYTLDRSVVDIETRSVLITFCNDNAILVLCKDITASKNAESSLIEIEHRFKSLVENNPDAICCFDLEGNFLSANPSAQILTGYREKELLEFSYISLFEHEQKEQAEYLFNKTKLGEAQIFESRIMLKNGFFAVWACKNVPIIVNGQVVGIFMISRDITEQKETENLLKRSEMLSIIGQLAAGVAHEIRNPLTSLKGFAQLLKGKYIEASRYFDIMLSELDRINDIVNEFMSVGKPQLMSSFQSNNINRILSGVVSFMSPQAVLNNVEIVEDLHDQLPHVLCDESQLKQVFINILKNAIEAMPNGGQVKVSSNFDSDSLIIQIVDHGCGIPEDRIKQLGEPFYTSKEKGTGLGLMVCFKLIQAHGGDIRIKSSLNSGTTVEILLPI